VPVFFVAYHGPMLSSSIHPLTSSPTYQEETMSYRFDPKAKYAKSHEWARVEGGTVVIGVSDYAQHLLSDVVYVELPEVGDTLTQGESLGTVESVKAAEDAYAPVSGEVIEVNTELEDNPEWVNEDPYGKAWLVKVTPSDLGELGALMDAAVYEKYVAEEEEKGGH
jgi:glycine cleavage system H protein